MTSQARQQIITINILPNILKSKDNQAIITFKGLPLMQIRTIFWEGESRTSNNNIYNNNANAIHFYKPNVEEYDYCKNC